MKRFRKLLQLGTLLLSIALITTSIPVSATETEGVQAYNMEESIPEESVQQEESTAWETVQPEESIPEETVQPEENVQPEETIEDDLTVEIIPDEMENEQDEDNSADEISTEDPVETFEVETEVTEVEETVEATAGDGTYIYPISTSATITATYYYSSGNLHGATDFYMPKGSPVYATAAGTVITASDSGCTGSHGTVSNSSYYCTTSGCSGNSAGNYIVIDHGNNVYSRYLHLQTGSFKVNVGDTVAQGQQIACVGNSGNTEGTTGVHLHFELRIGANDYAHRVDPLDYLTKTNTPSGGSSSSDYVDVGTGFYAYLVFTYPWKELGLSDTNVQTENTVETSDHIWYFERQSNGSYKITNAYNGQCLDVSNAGGSGANVWTYDSNDSSAQRWYITGYSSCYQLHPACATDCSLDVSGSNYDDNLNVQIWTTNGSTAQNFQIYHADENLGGSVITTSVNAGNLTVNWTSRPYADAYHIRVFKDTNYTGTDYTYWYGSGNTVTMELPDGHYYVYVDAGNSLFYIQSNIIEVDIKRPESVKSITYKGNTYTLYNALVNWSYAKSYCEGLGGHLAVITSADESTQIAALLGGTSSVYYIGGSDAASEGTWTWVTGESLSYTNWASGEPNNTGGNEDSLCVYLSNGSALWNDTSEANVFGFICEQECTHTWNSGVVTKEATTTQTGVKTYTCTQCGKTKTETIPVKDPTSTCDHNYVSQNLPTTCNEIQKIRYTCTKCGGTYDSQAPDQWSDWSTTYPQGVDSSTVQTGTQYRYSDYVTTESTSSSLSGYTQTGSYWKQTGSGTIKYVSSWPSGFDKNNSLYSTYNKTPVSASETSSSKTTVSSSTAGYIYYHWCRGTYTGGPINRLTSTSYTSTFNSFHAFFSTTSPSTLTTAEDSYQYANSSCCTDSYWYYPVTVTQQNYTNYTKYYSYGKWSDMSAWSSTAVSSSSTRKVETRTVYRYNSAPRGEHSWNSGVVTQEATETSDGVKTYTCTICGATKTETILRKLQAPSQFTLSATEINEGESVTLSWNAVSSAEKYKVCLYYYGDNSGITYDYYDAGTATQYTFTNLKVRNGGYAYYVYSIRGTEEAEGTDYGNIFVNHIWDSGTVTKAATTTEEGVRTYTCTYCGTTKTETIDKIQDVPVITLHPEDTTVVAGEIFDFSIIAKGTGLTYLWQYSKDNGTTWTDTTRTKDNYSTTATDGLNGRMYRCVVTDASENSAISESATLTVKPAIGITNQTGSLTVNAGESYRFRVTAVSNRGSSLTYLWQYSKNLKTWTDTTRKLNNYGTTANTAMDGMYYRCKVTDADGYVAYSEPAMLRVLSTITITSQPEDQVGTIGVKFTFRVGATGSSLTYLWQYSKDGGQTWINTSRTRNNYGTLATYALNGRMYRCIITDSSNNTVISNAATLTVE